LPDFWRCQNYLFFLLEAVEVDDVLVSQSRYSVHLATEATHKLQILGQVFSQDFDRHEVVALAVQRLVHFGHSALTDGSFDVMPGEQCPPN
jgi:hypothetical protein